MITNGLVALTTFDEWNEVHNVLDNKPSDQIKLKYIGKQEFPGEEPVRLWNIECFGHLFNHSTRSLVGLRELGIIK